MGWADSVDWGSLAGAGITAAGDIAKARAAGQKKQADAQVPVDQLNQQAYRTDLSTKQQALDAQDAARLARALGMLQENAANQKAPQQRASNAVRGDILANSHNVEFDGGSSRIPSFSFDGGLAPDDIYSDNTRSLGKDMSREALMDQLGKRPTPFSDLPDADYSSVLNAAGAPGGTALPSTSRLDSVLAAIGSYGAMGTKMLDAAQGPPAAAPPSAPGVAPIQGFPGQVVPGASPPPTQAPMLQGRVIGNGMAPTARAY